LTPGSPVAVGLEPKLEMCGVQLKTANPFPANVVPVTVTFAQVSVFEHSGLAVMATTAPVMLEFLEMLPVDPAQNVRPAQKMSALKAVPVAVTVPCTEKVALPRTSESVAAKVPLGLTSRLETTYVPCELLASFQVLSLGTVEPLTAK